MSGGMAAGCQPPPLWEPPLWPFRPMAAMGLSREIPIAGMPAPTTSAALVANFAVLRQNSPRRRRCQALPHPSFPRERESMDVDASMRKSLGSRFRGSDGRRCVSGSRSVSGFKAGEAAQPRPCCDRALGLPASSSCPPAYEVEQPLSPRNPAPIIPPAPAPGARSRTDRGRGAWLRTGRRRWRPGWSRPGPAPRRGRPRSRS